MIDSIDLPGGYVNCGGNENPGGRVKFGGNENCGGQVKSGGKVYAVG